MAEEIKNILLPVDGSEPSRRALDKGIYLAQKCGASLTLLYVVDMNKNISAFEQVSTGGYVPGEIKVEGYKVLMDMLRSVPQGIDVNYVVKVGNPGKTIVAYCEEQTFDLILIGSRGMSTYLKQILLGSVSQYVLLRSTCPIMIVK